MSQPFDIMAAASLVSLAVLCVLALRKMFGTDRFHTLRVVVITALLWAAVLALFLLAFPPAHGDCVVSWPSEAHAHARSRGPRVSL